VKDLGATVSMFSRELGKSNEKHIHSNLSRH